MLEIKAIRLIEGPVIAAAPLGPFNSPPGTPNWANENYANTVAIAFANMIGVSMGNLPGVVNNGWQGTYFQDPGAGPPPFDPGLPGGGWGGGGGGGVIP